MTPFNDKFNDTYWHPHQALNQSRQVFASVMAVGLGVCKEEFSQNELDEIGFLDDFKLALPRSAQSPFIVGELGFGAGLNFLNTAEIFKKAGKKLHYVGIEFDPISPQRLLQIYSHLDGLPDASELINALKANPLKPGFNRINLNPLICLDLLICQANDALCQSEFKADVWYLDGFAPAKNPDMWSSTIMQEIARLSKKGTIISTYSAASVVAWNLKSAGFSVKKLKGIGKRERLIAQLKTDPLPKKSDQIYFTRPNAPNPSNNPKALIIGAGIAGICSALELKRAGYECILADKASQIASNGSSNLIGALMPLITKDGVLLGEFSKIACDMALEFYKQELNSELFKPCLALSYAHNEELYARYKDKSEFDKDKNAIISKDAACIAVRSACKHLARDLNFLPEHSLISLSQTEQGWDALFQTKQNTKLISADIVVLAIGSDSTGLFNGDIKINQAKGAINSLDSSVLISSLRGQTTLIADAPLAPHIDPLAIHNAKGYLTLSFNKARIIGATFSRNDDEKTPRVQDDEINLKDTAQFFNQTPQILSSNVGFRSYSQDRLPMIGAVHNALNFKDDYASIFWGKKSSIKPKYLQGLFISTAHGARGLSSAVLAGRLIADLATNRPLCVPKNILRATHLARFLIRNLKKGIKC